jgi:hypothetical protein
MGQRPHAWSAIQIAVLAHLCPYLGRWHREIHSRACPILNYLARTFLPFVVSFSNDQHRARTLDGTSVRGGNCRASLTKCEVKIMGFGKGALLWLIGIPLPIIIVIAILMHQ